MTKHETCVECGERTGRAGRGDDSIYDEIGAGPYCEDCYSIIADLDNLAKERSSRLGVLRTRVSNLEKALEEIVATADRWGGPGNSHQYHGLIATPAARAGLQDGWHAAGQIARAALYENENKNPS